MHDSNVTGHPRPPSISDTQRFPTKEGSDFNSNQSQSLGHPQIPKRCCYSHKFSQMLMSLSQMQRNPPLRLWRGLGEGRQDLSGGERGGGD